MRKLIPGVQFYPVKHQKFIKGSVCMMKTAWIFNAYNKLLKAGDK